MWHLMWSETSCAVVCCDETDSKAWSHKNVWDETIGIIFGVIIVIIVIITIIIIVIKVSMKTESIILLKSHLVSHHTVCLSADFAASSSIQDIAPVITASLHLPWTHVFYFLKQRVFCQVSVFDRIWLDKNRLSCTVLKCTQLTSAAVYHVEQHSVTVHCKLNSVQQLQLQCSEAAERFCFPWQPATASRDPLTLGCQPSFYALILIFGWFRS